MDTIFVLPERFRRILMSLLGLAHRQLMTSFRSAVLATRLWPGHARLVYSSLARRDRDMADQDPRMTKCVRKIVPNPGETFEKAEKARRLVMIISYYFVLPW